MPDAAALTFAIEFATDKGKAALQALVPDVVGIVQSILAPISPSNLVTQIAQQGLGINGLAGNLVSGGVGALAGSDRFGYLAQMGAEFNAQNGALRQSVGDARRNAELGLPNTDDVIQQNWRVNLARAQAAEQAEMNVNRTLGKNLADQDIQMLRQVGTKLWNDESVQKARAGAEFYGGVAKDFWDLMHPRPDGSLGR